MTPDLYFDCPRCAHTMMVEPSLVGKLVECPDCGEDIEVPDIRDGVHPRFRGQRRTDRGTVVLSGRNAPAGVSDVDALEDNLGSLLRRREEQARQLEYIRFNAELCVKQIRILTSQTVDLSAASAPPPADRANAAPADGKSPLMRWSAALAAAALVVAAVLLITLVI